MQQVRKTNSKSHLFNRFQFVMSIDVSMIIEESNSFSSIQKIERAQDTMINHDVMLYFIFLIERYKQRQYAIDKFDQAVLFVDDI